MLFHTDAKITNDVLLNDDHVGQQVEWVAVLRNLQTGQVHRTIACSGKFVGTYVEPESGWLYAEFEGCFLNGAPEEYVGVPLAFFR